MMRTGHRSHPTRSNQRCGMRCRPPHSPRRSTHPRSHHCPHRHHPTTMTLKCTRPQEFRSPHQLPHHPSHCRMLGSLDNRGLISQMKRRCRGAGRDRVVHITILALLLVGALQSVLLLVAASYCPTLALPRCAQRLLLNHLHRYRQCQSARYPLSPQLFFFRPMQRSISFECSCRVPSPPPRCFPTRPPHNIPFFWSAAATFSTPQSRQSVHTLKACALRFATPPHFR